MANAEKRLFVISYDFKKQVYKEKPEFISNIGREKMILFLLKIGGKNLQSFTDSTIHFALIIKQPTIQLKELFEQIKAEFPKLYFSINLVAKFTPKDKPTNHLAYKKFENETSKGAGDGFKNLFDIDVKAIEQGLKKIKK